MADLETLGGTWRTSAWREYVKDGVTGEPLDYKAFRDNKERETSRGCFIDLYFMPNDTVLAEQISLVQTSKGTVVHKGKKDPEVDYHGDTERKARSTKTNDPGRHLDRDAGTTSPIYGVETAKDNPSLTTDSDDVTLRGGNHRFGKRVLGAKGDEVDEAFLHDGPASHWSPGDTLELKFETTALAVKGMQQGAYYGSVSWGCKVNPDGSITLQDPEVASMGLPTEAFMEAAGAWNTSTTNVGTEEQPQTAETGDLPISGARVSNANTSLDPKALETATDEELLVVIKALQELRGAKDASAIDRTNALYQQLAVESFLDDIGNFSDVALNKRIMEVRTLQNLLIAEKNANLVRLKELKDKDAKNTDEEMRELKTLDPRQTEVLKKLLPECKAALLKLKAERAKRDESSKDQQKSGGAGGG